MVTIFLREGIGFRSMRWDELVLLMEGISPEASRRKRLQAVSPSPPDGGSEKSPSSSQNTVTIRNRMRGGVRGWKTKVGRKLLRFPPTRFRKALEEAQVY